jgi:ABC-2 type transport system permease protein
MVSGACKFPIKKKMKIMNAITELIVSSHIWALVLKETREILRNKYLLFLIVVPPIVQLLILGGALDPQVRNLSLATVDHAQTEQSRDLVAGFIGSGVFARNTYLQNEQILSGQLEKGQLNVGLVIPPDFSNDLNRGKAANVQVLIDGADAYTAGIASSYVLRTIHQFHPDSSARTPSLIKSSANNIDNSEEQDQSIALIDPRIDILYNPGQVSSWFFVPGILGACLTLTGTLVSAATVLRERESGTMEQLLMTPASTWEILLAKIIPLIVFLLGDVVMAIGAARIIFGMPFRGSVILFLLASALYAFVGIGLGMMLGSICRNQRQAQLASFFINIPLILLSGTVVPLDTMPWLLQMISFTDPLRYYTLIARGIILKGETLPMLWQQLLLLALSAVLVLTISANRFRRQLV